MNPAQPIQELRPEVIAFAVMMEQRLRDMDAALAQEYKHRSKTYVMFQAITKVYSIDRDLKHGAYLDVVMHSVDLANYSMMFAHLCGFLRLLDEDGTWRCSPVWQRNDEATYHTLLLVSGHNVSMDAINSWSDEQCRQAEEWAMAIHLQARDNEGVEVPRTPECVMPFLVR